MRALLLIALLCAVVLVPAVAIQRSSTTTSVLERTATDLQSLERLRRADVDVQVQWTGHPWTKVAPPAHGWVHNLGVVDLINKWEAADLAGVGDRLTKVGAQIDNTILTTLNRDGLGRPTAAEFFPKLSAAGTCNCVQKFTELQAAGHTRGGARADVQAGHICGAKICGAAETGAGDAVPAGLWANVNPRNFFPQSDRSNHGRYYQMEVAVKKLITKHAACRAGGMQVRIEFAYTVPGKKNGDGGVVGDDFLVEEARTSHYKLYLSLDCWEAVLDDIISTAGVGPGLSRFPFLIADAKANGRYFVDRPWGNGDAAGMDGEKVAYHDADSKALQATVKADIASRGAYVAAAGTLNGKVAALDCVNKCTTLHGHNVAAGKSAGETYAPTPAGPPNLVMAPVVGRLNTAYTTADTNCKLVVAAKTISDNAKAKMDGYVASNAAKCRVDYKGYATEHKKIVDATAEVDAKGALFTAAYNTFKGEWNGLLGQRATYPTLKKQFEHDIVLPPPRPQSLTARLSARLHRLRKQQKLQQSQVSSSVSHERFPILKMQQRKHSKKH